MSCLGSVACFPPASSADLYRDLLEAEQLCGSVLWLAAQLGVQLRRLALYMGPYLILIRVCPAALASMGLLELIEGHEPHGATHPGAPASFAICNLRLEPAMFAEHEDPVYIIEVLQMIPPNSLPESLVECAWALYEALEVQHGVPPAPSAAPRECL